MKFSKKYIDKVLIIIGSAIVALGLCNIHSKVGISEGGQLGVELLIYNWLGISPAIVALIIDIVVYTLGYILLGKRFLLNSIIGTISYSLFYFVFAHTLPIIPDLSNHLFLASILGGLLVGIGCGLVVGLNGSCGGDDAIVLVMAKTTKLPVALCYFLLDILVILLSLTYIQLGKIIYSLITAFISSLLIGWISNLKIIKSIKEGKTR